MNIKTIAALSIGLMSIAGSTDTFAEQNGQPLHWLLGLGLTAGGDKLGTIVYQDGDTADINAGDLVHIYGGFTYSHSPMFESKVTIGYHFDEATASNGTVTFSRIPIEYVASYVIDNHRIGGGLAYHTNTKLDESDFGYSDVKFDDALGFLVEYSYQFVSWFNVAVRYEAIEYKVSDPYITFNGSNKVSGNHAGLYANFSF